MTPMPLTLVITPPRCGSTWAYNAARRILSEAGCIVRPKDVPLTPEDYLNAFAEAAQNRDPQRCYVLKTHQVMLLNGGGILALSVLRDPRDIALSHRRFSEQTAKNLTFDAVVAQTIQLYDRIADAWGTRLRQLRYEDIETDPAGCVATLRAALRVEADAASDTAIAAALSPDAARRRIAEAERRAASGEARFQPQEGGRALDPESGLQSGHLAETPTDWRGMISADDARRVADRHGDWLAAHGFGANDIGR